MMHFVHTRPYKEALTYEEAIEIIAKGDGRTRPEHFDPELLKIFVENSKQINELWNNLNKRGLNVVDTKEVVKCAQHLLTS